MADQVGAKRARDRKLGLFVATHTENVVARAAAASKNNRWRRTQLQQKQQQLLPLSSGWIRRRGIRSHHSHQLYQQEEEESKASSEHTEEEKVEKVACKRSITGCSTRRSSKTSSPDNYIKEGGVGEEEFKKFSISSRDMFAALGDTNTGLISVRPGLSTALELLGVHPELKANVLADWSSHAFIDRPTFAAVLALPSLSPRQTHSPFEELQLHSQPSEPLIGVFLGGACNPTTWRKTIAVPLLEQHGITYYNPQVDEWSPELVPLEARMKAGAKVLLFVIGSRTRSIASMIEAGECITAGRRVVVVIEPFPDRDGVSDFSAAELKDLQRGRAYLADIAARHTTEVYTSLGASLHGLIDSFQEEKRDIGALGLNVLGSMLT